jgi:hypothetical protein
MGALAAFVSVTALSSAGLAQPSGAAPGPSTSSDGAESRPGDAETEGEVAGACTDTAEVCGKRAFQKGIQAYEAGRYGEALALFREAHSRKSHPVILFNVALAEAKTGLVVEALGHLDEVFVDPATPGNLLERAREERAQTAARVAAVAVEEKGAKLFVDGALASGDPPEVRVNPGKHRVRVEVDGKPVLDREILLGSGERVRLSVARAPVAETPPGSSGPPGAKADVHAEPRKPLSKTWVFVGGGLTLAAGAATAWSGLATRRAFTDFESDVDSLSREEAKQRMDEGRSKQLRTNVLLGASLALGIGTTVLAVTLVSWKREQTEVSLRLAPGGATLLGSF